MLLASILHAKCVIIEQKVYILFKKHLNTYTHKPLYSVLVNTVYCGGEAVVT